MANMGDGYGSECHLLRWMGRHRKAFDVAVTMALHQRVATMDWLDFEFAPGKTWADRELKGLEFLYEDASLKQAWMSFWPTGSGVHNWDAVGWVTAGAGRELVLVEAKAHLGELNSSCTATSQQSIETIEAAFAQTKAFLGVDSSRNWSRDYYQFANRLATLYFLHTRGIKARLLFIYFVGDRVGPSRSCPVNVAGWQEALQHQEDSLGLGVQHPLLDRVHKLFLHTSSDQRC